MIKFDGNCYFLKGHITDIITTTGQGREPDIALEKWEKSIIPHLEKILLNNKDIKTGGKKAVFFVEFENVKWLESGSLKDTEKIIVTVINMKMTVTEFKKLDKQLKKEDAKALTKIDKEESYE